MGRSRKENTLLKDYALEDTLLENKITIGDILLEEQLAIKKCKKCDKTGKGRECDACGIWECLQCAPHDSSKKRKISEALKIKGLFWNCRECEDQIKDVKNKGCIHCNEERDGLFYMNCDYCNAWKCEECLITKENLKRNKCIAIREKTSDEAELQLSWACNNCSTRKELRQTIAEEDKEAKKSTQLGKKTKELTDELKKLEEELEKKKVRIEELEAEKCEDCTGKKETGTKKGPRNNEPDEEKSQVDDKDNKEESIEIKDQRNRYLKKRNKRLKEEIKKMKKKAEKAEKFIRELERNLGEDIKEKEIMLAEEEKKKEEQDKLIQEYKHDLEVAEYERELYRAGVVTEHDKNKELNTTVELCQKKIEELEEDFMRELKK